jgi:hypothetical protein
VKQLAAHLSTSVSSRLLKMTLGIPYSVVKELTYEKAESVTCQLETVSGVW